MIITCTAQQLKRGDFIINFGKGTLNCLLFKTPPEWSFIVLQTMKITKYYQIGYFDLLTCTCNKIFSIPTANFLVIR